MQEKRGNQVPDPEFLPSLSTETDLSLTSIAKGRKSFPMVQGIPTLDGREEKWEQKSTSAALIWID